MKFSFRKSERLAADVQIAEIDERHHLAQHVFFRREEKGWTQDELAKMVGTTQAQIANIEAGTVNPTLRTLVRLAHVFGCHIRDLFCPTAGDVEMDVVRESIDRVRSFFAKESKAVAFTSAKGSFCPQPEQSWDTVFAVNKAIRRWSNVEATNVRRYNPNEALAISA